MKPWLVTLWSVACMACAGSASNLKPDSIGRDEGAIVGRIVMHNHDKDVTSDCFAFFVDPAGDAKATLQLEPNGWVFTTLDRGDTRLSEIRCSIGWAVAFRVEGVRFHVSGEGGASYFGHVNVQLNSTAPSLGKVLVESGGGGLVGAAIAASMRQPKKDPGSMRVDRRLDYAQREYRARYGPGSELRLFDGVGRRGAPPQAQVNRELMRAETNLDGIKLVWLGMPRDQPNQVGLRFERYVKKPELEGCNSLGIQIDGERSECSVHQRTDGGFTIIEETIRGQMDVRVLQHMAAAKQVVFDLCGVQRTLGPEALQVTQQFAARFQKISASDSVQTAEAAASPRLGAASGGEPLTAAPKPVQP